MIGDLEHITQSMPTPFKHADESTWRTWWELAPTPHVATTLEVRSHPNHPEHSTKSNKVVKVFEDIWKTPSEQSLTSFDGVTLHFPPEKHVEDGIVIHGHTPTTSRSCVLNSNVYNLGLLL